MGKCKHENVSDKYGETTRDHNGDIVYEVEYRECLDCGHWLSLGPARDDERTAIEVRAAELAATWDPDSGWWDGFVSLGMCSPEAQHAPLIEADIASGRKYQRDLDDYYAGHLARTIADHREAQ